MVKANETLAGCVDLVSAITNPPADWTECAKLPYKHGMPALPLWIDALCINQADVAEKTHQVGLMGRIYRQSQNTLAWLGPKDATSSAVLTLTKALAEDWTDSDDGSLTWLASPLYDALLYLLSDREPMEAVGDLFMRRPYWSRAWVLQEMALSERLTIVCGGDICPGDNDRRAWL
jgi:hypothetical protein